MPKSYGLKDHNLIKYKIHGIDSVTGESRSANNNVFYDTLEEAVAQCRTYLARPSNCSGFVIMKTAAVVKPVEAPIKVFHLDADDYFSEEDA